MWASTWYIPKENYYLVSGIGIAAGEVVASGSSESKT
jgi:hypothetical protein